MLIFFSATQQGAAHAQSRKKASGPFARHRSTVVRPAARPMIEFESLVVPPHRENGTSNVLLRIAPFADRNRDDRRSASRNRIVLTHPLVDVICTYITGSCLTFSTLPIVPEIAILAPGMRVADAIDPETTILCEIKDQNLPESKSSRSR